MSDVTVTMGVDNRQAITALKAIETQTDKISQAFAGLKGVIGGLAIGSFVQQISQYASTVNNAANATGLGVDSVKAFSDAIVSAGGDAKGAVEDLTEFTKKIYEAKNGSDETAKMFAGLGISLSQLRSMSEKDILKKTLDSLSKMEDATKRNKIGMDLLGGEFKKVNSQEVAKNFGQNMGSTQNTQAAAAIQSMGEAQKNLAKIFKDVGNEILISLKPIADFTKELKVSHEAIVKTVAFMKELLYWGVQIGSFFVGGIIVKGLMKLAEGVLFLANSIRVLTRMTPSMKPVTDFFAGISRFITGKVGSNNRITATTKQIDTLQGKLASLGKGKGSAGEAAHIGEQIKQLSMYREGLEAVTKKSSTILGIIVATGVTFRDFFRAIWTGVAPLNSVEAAIHSVIKPVKDLAMAFVDGYNAVNQYVKSIPYVGEALAVIVTPIHALIWAFNDLFSDAEGGGQIMNALGASLEFVARGIGELLNLPTNIIGSILGYGWNEAIGLGTWALNLAKEAENARKGLKPATVDPSENNAEMNKLLRQQKNAQESIKEKTKETSDEYKRLKMEVEQVGKAFAQANDLKLQDLAFQTRLIGKTEDQKEMLQASYELAKNYDSTIAGLVQKQNEWKNGTEEQKGALHLITAEIKKITDEYESQRGKLSEYVTALQSARLIEQDRLNTQQNITDEINKQIERQNTLAGIIQSANDKSVALKFDASQMGKSPFEQQIAQINEDARLAALEAGRAFAAGFEDSGDGLTPEKAAELAQGLDTIAKKYKGIAITQIENLNASRTWKSGWDTAFNEYVDSATNAANMAKDAFSSFSGNMDTMIDTFVSTGKLAFGDFARSVIADLIKIELKAQAMKLLQMLPGGGIGGAMGSLSSFIGGFFAEGGQPPLNKASIVGERGPELFVPKSAGTIIPNGQFGGSSAPQPIVNNTYITNSVSAIDAKSVAQLFQENRRQLFGVVEQAKKEMPGRSR